MSSLMEDWGVEGGERIKIFGIFFSFFKKQLGKKCLKKIATFVKSIK